MKNYQDIYALVEVKEIDAYESGYNDGYRVTNEYCIGRGTKVINSKSYNSISELFCCDKEIKHEQCIKEKES